MWKKTGFWASSRRSRMPSSRPPWTMNILRPPKTPASSSGASWQRSGSKNLLIFCHILLLFKNPFSPAGEEPAAAVLLWQQGSRDFYQQGHHDHQVHLWDLRNLLLLISLLTGLKRKTLRISTWIRFARKHLCGSLERLHLIDTGLAYKNYNEWNADGDAW